MSCLNVVAALIVRDNGEVLCVKRGASKFASTAWKWEFPGGKIEPGETLEQCAVREVREELEMVVEPLALACTTEHTYPEFAIHLQCVLCAAHDQEPTLKEHVEARWVKADDLSLLDFAAADTAILAWLRERTFGTQLRTKVIGTNCTFVEATDSTNTQLLALAERGAPEGSLYVAETQWAGRGRLGRTWLDIPGNALLFSLLVRPQVAPEVAVTVSLVAGIAMALALRKAASLQVGLKWPNDLLIDDRKLCGILCEAQTSVNGIEGIVIGIGVNTAAVPEAVAHRAIGSEKRLDRLALLATFCNTFEPLYARWQAGGLAALREEIDAFDCKRGHLITIKQSTLIEGIARGIRDDGALLLETPDGILPITCGEIQQWDTADTENYPSRR